MRPVLILFLASNLIFLCGMELLEHREEIGTLKDQAGAQNQINQASKEAEAAFQKVAEAVKSGKIRSGTLSKDVKSRHGAPSAVSPEGDGQRWLYRSMKGKTLERPWIFLYFDKGGSLVRQECGHTDACPEPVVI